jgi:3-phenylpropionate/trans-cinnamate dioxygenase ferredoxin subunit
LDSYILTCPCHDWRFDIRDGRFLDAPELSLKTYPTKTENGKIYIDFN